jgi:signal transduction histidine kinase
MRMEIRDIEKFFLDTILMISIGGVFLIIVSNLLLFPEDTLSIAISVAMLCAFVIAYVLRRRHPTVAVIIVTSVALITMSYQRLTVPNTMTTLSVVMIVGFIFSVMLKGRLMWIMHGIAFIIINTLFVFHLPDAITAAITYSVLYFVLSYATGVLKANYDRILEYLRDSNIQLNEKSKEIETQNEELLQIQDNLNALNTHLEEVVNERTAKIQLQNEILFKYSYRNAHHLRGPVARLLGLASIYKLDATQSADFYVEKMVDQAHEIDAVIKQINVDLEVGKVEIKKES